MVNSISMKDISLQKVCDELELTDDQCCLADKTMKFLGYGGLAVAVGMYGIPFVLAELGFSTVGVVGGSFAAWWQSVGVAPTLFSAVQSTSMTGGAAALVTKLGVTASAAKSYFSSCVTTQSSETKDCNKNCK